MHECREIGDAQRLGVMVADMRGDAPDARGVAVSQPDLPQRRAERTIQQPPHDLLPDQRSEHEKVGDQRRQPPPPLCASSRYRSQMSATVDPARTASRVSIGSSPVPRQPAASAPRSAPARPSARRTGQASTGGQSLRKSEP